MVKRRVSSTFCIEPGDTATPYIGGAIGGVRHVKDYHRAETIAGHAKHSDELPTRGLHQLFDCRLAGAFSLIAFRLAVYILRSDKTASAVLLWLSCDGLIHQTRQKTGRSTVKREVVKWAFAR